MLHEIDIVALCQPAYGILELKNRLSGPPDKNDVIVFFAKILDYICNNPAILRGHLVPIFVSSTPFEQPTLAACLGLGIHPVSPMFRPLPMLLDAANRMSGEIERGLVLLPDDFLAFEDFMLRSNHVARVLAGADANSRFDLYDNLTVAVRSSGDVDVQGLAIEMRALNSECSRLIAVVRGLKQAGGRTL
ncbi:MAG: hypothetical protein E5Y59_02805 [Mesorhizobium sp.]|nr:MAG: hypothetical protein E5Y59_02805 [Mesorhizobium sp.]